MAKKEDLKKEMQVWVLSVLKKGEVYTRKIFDFTTEMGKTRVLLSKFNCERNYSPSELIIDEAEAIGIARDVLKKRKQEIEGRIDKLTLRLIEIGQKNKATGNIKRVA